MTKEELLEQIHAQLTKRASLEGTLQGAIVPQVLDCGDGWVEYQFPVAEWMRNPYGIMHGGVAATMLDSAMGIYACALSRNVPVTISMSLNYIQPVTLDRPLFVTVRCQHCGKSVAYLTAEAWQERGKTIVTASGSFYVTGISGGVSSASDSTSSAETAEIS